MELRYMGFEQLRNARAYRFDAIEKGQLPRHFVVTADLALFLRHRIAIQEGPTLSASKLTADLEKDVAGAHELTSDDLRAHADARTLAEARRAEMKRTPRRRPAPSDEAPRRNFGL
jgi:hypothetical protein